MAGGMLLAAAAALTVLINATYQDGAREGYPPLLLRWTATAAALLLFPLIVLAAYGIALRIGQYGLTPERIYAVACLVVGCAYAVGYAWAAVAPGRWMLRLERVNVTVAHLVVLILLLLFSPLVDPVRLSVGDQVGRLRSGAVTPDAFDYTFLRFDSGRWGRAALTKLAQDADPAIQRRAVAAQRRETRSGPPPRDELDRRKLLQPVDAALPTDFLAQAWSQADEPAVECEPACPALLRDLDGDGVAEIIVFQRYGRPVYSRTAPSGWRRSGRLAGGCPGDADAVRAGRFAIEPAQGSAVVVNGRRLVLDRVPDCRADEGSAPAPPGG
jgi:hypothetical protein